MSEKVKITVKPNGSIRVEGDFELNYTKQGESEVTTEVDIPRKSHFAMAPIEKLVFRVKPNNLCQK